MNENKRKSHTRTWRQFLSVLLVFSTLVVFFGNLWTRSRTYSDVENKVLASFPGRPSARGLWDGSYAASWTDAYNDHFFLRDQWIRLRCEARLLLGASEFEGGYFGEDGYLLSSPVTPDEARQQALLDALNAFARRHSTLSMNLILVPDAASVLAGKLPQGAPVRDQRADIASFTARLKGYGTVDAGTILEKTAACGTQVFYRTDHHWTTFGAYAVLDGACDTLGIGGLVPCQFYRVSDSFQGTLSSRSGFTREYDEIYVGVPQDQDAYEYVVYDPETREKKASLFEADRLTQKDQYEVFEGGNHARLEIETSSGDGRTLLVIKDSFANCLIPLLVPYYSRIIVADPRCGYDQADELLSLYSVTDVLILYSADTLWQDTSLIPFLEP